MTFGILTLTTPADFRKAIGLALSVRISNPGVPIAVACSPQLKSALAPFFDYVIDENPALKGFVHKVYLDCYSPFNETFFFDADVLIFRPLTEVLAQWRTQRYAACGNYVQGGFSPFGLDRESILRKIQKRRLVHIDGAGHAYFRKPECSDVFEQARYITANYSTYAGDIRYADEDVMDIVLTMLDIAPMPRAGFFSRYCSATKGTMRMDATTATCSYRAVTSGAEERPYMTHFAGNEAPLPYLRQLLASLQACGTKHAWSLRRRAQELIRSRNQMASPQAGKGVASAR